MSGSLVRRDLQRFPIFFLTCGISLSRARCVPRISLRSSPCRILNVLAAALRWLRPSAPASAKASSLRFRSPVRSSGRCGSGRLWRGGLRKTASQPVWIAVTAAGSYSAGTSRRADRLPEQAKPLCPKDFLRQPLRGGPLLPHRSVARRSPWTSMAPSSLLALGQNRLRHSGAT